MPVTTRFHTLSVRDLLADDAVLIPEHQRPEIWKADKKAGLVRTVLAGLPLGMLIFHEEMAAGHRTRWLEDGQQRYWSIYRYKQDSFKAALPSGEEKLYSELTPDEQARFNWYQIPVLTYENATPEERLYIFQYLQNGVPLTSGQRFHAMSAMSPLVRHAQQLMGDERMSAVFGFGAGLRDNKSKTQLQNAMAIVGGICLGPGFITTSYDILGPELLRAVPLTAVNALDMLLTVYKAAQDISPWSNRELKKYQWPVGKLTGYILWSIVEAMRLGSGLNELIDGWITFLVHVRADRRILNVLHKGMPASRNWTSERWRIGFENIFIGSPDDAVLNEEALAEDLPEAADSDDESDA